MSITERAIGRSGVKTAVASPDIVIDAATVKSLVEKRQEAEKEDAVFGERLSSMEAQEAEIHKRVFERWGIKGTPAILEALNRLEQDLATQVQAMDAVIDGLAATLQAVPEASRKAKFAGADRFVAGWQALRSSH